MADAHTPDRSSDPVYIFADGCALGRRGPGGYGVIIRDGDGPERIAKAGFQLTTRNRMQLRAVLHGLRETAAAGVGRKTIVESGSRYVVNPIEQGWLVNWEHSGWKRGLHQVPVKNADLWQEMVELLDGREVKLIWARSRPDNRECQQCDELANVAALQHESELEVDEVGEHIPAAAPHPDVIFIEESSETESESNTIEETFSRESHDAVLEESSEPESATLEESSEPVPSNDGAAPSFTHLDDRGAARMVDVGDKPATVRRATASCRVAMSASTVEAIRDGGFSKGDVLAVARVAGIAAAKRTWELIPMCHQIPLSYVKVALEFVDDVAGSGISVTATAQARAETGVEMEALTAASVAALTIYDMCKSAERGIVIHGLRLLRKTGGASGDYVAE